MPGTNGLTEIRGSGLICRALVATSSYEVSTCEKADLHDADLRHALLNGAHLGLANLAGADLREASLRWADLNHANMTGANLTRADLHAASMLQVSLRGAILDGANLTAAMVNGDMSGAILRSARLSSTEILSSRMSGADFHDAVCEGTVFANLDLSACEGLAGVRHERPSTVGVDTLYRSKGKLSKTFLRGCGLRDWEIEVTHLHRAALSNPQVDEILYRVAALRYGQSILSYTCFISYSNKDQDFAEQLHADLQNSGVRCWFAPHHVRAGRKLQPQISEAIHLYDRLLLIISDHSMTSEWVKTEIAHARQRELKEGRQILFPISIIPFDRIREWKCFDADTGKDSAREIRDYFIRDFSGWQNRRLYQAAFRRLLKDLTSEESGCHRTDDTAPSV